MTKEAKSLGLAIAQALLEELRELQADAVVTVEVEDTGSFKKQLVTVRVNGKTYTLSKFE